MTYAPWLEQRKIRPHELRPGEVARRLGELWANHAVALEDARIVGPSFGGRFQHAYNALRYLAEIVMTAEGYRPATG